MTYEKSFDTIDEFVDNISRGGEVELEYNGKLYFAGMIGEINGLHVSNTMMNRAKNMYRRKKYAHIR